MGGTSGVKPPRRRWQNRAVDDDDRWLRQGTEELADDRFNGSIVWHR
jgi:hypothetical protein